MLDFLKLGHRIDHGEIGKKAVQTAQSIATRWDVVQGERKPGQADDDDTPYVQIEGEWYEIPPDLRDTRPRLYRTAPDPVTGRQGRVAGRILPDDLVSGSASSAVPVLFAFVPFLALLLFWGAAIGTSLILVPAGLALGVCLAFIANATSTSGKSWAFLSLLAALLPMKALTDGVLGKITSGAPAIFGTAFGAASFTSGMIFITAISFLYGGLRAARVTLGVLIGVAVVVMLSGHVPDLIKPAVLLAPACALPWGWAFFLRRQRGIELAVYGTTCNWEDSANGLSHVDARRAQTLRAAKDYATCKTMLCFGTATGDLSVNMFSGYAPDPGLPVWMEPSAIAQHMIILGANGAGKTVLLTQLIQHYLRWGMGGLVIMDGKGALAGEFRHLKNYIYLDPRECVISLYEGLDPAGVTAAYAQINMRPDSKDPTWQNTTSDVISNTAQILWYLVKYADAMNTPIEDREWNWCMYDHDRLALLALSEKEDDRAEVGKYLTFLKAAFPDEMAGLLGGAINFVENTMGGWNDSFRGSVLGTYGYWTSPLLSQKDIQRWARAVRSDKDPEACLFGGIIGINLGENMFGRAGVIACSFLKNRIYSKGKKRADFGNEWASKIPGATPCWFVQDEYPAIATEAEVNIALQGRSVGLWLCCLAQNVEAIYATNHNKNSIDAFLGNLLSRIVMQTTPGTAKWLQDTVGPVWIPGWMKNTQGIDYVSSAVNALGSVLYDITHPDRSFFKSLLRRGFGAFHKIHFPRTGRQVVTSDDHAEMSTRHNVVTGGNWHEEPLVNLADFIGKTQKITKGGMGMKPEGGIAYVQVMRAGVIRHDYVQLLPPGPIADDLLDPDYILERDRKRVFDQVDAVLASKEEVKEAA